MQRNVFFPTAPNVDTFDELREHLLDELDDQDERDKAFINYVESDGRREDIANAFRSLAGRISAMQEYFVASLTDEQLAELLPRGHKLAPDEEGDDAER